MRRESKKILKMLMGSVAERVLRLLYPVRCPFCDEPVLRTEGIVCTSCLSRVHMVEDPFCCKCGKQLKSRETEYCADCMRIRHAYDSGRSLLVYGDAVRASVYRFKYGGRKEYARAYAVLAEEGLGDFIREINPDALIPVPLHRARFHKRGYNQAELLAEEIGKRMEIPVLTDVVQRTINTTPQKELDFWQRQNNLKKAFKINRNDVKLYTTIIIDDIYTTGSTIDAVSEVLKEMGVKKVYFVCLAGGK